MVKSSNERARYSLTLTYISTCYQKNLDFIVLLIVFYYWGEREIGQRATGECET